MKSEPGAVATGSPAKIAWWPLFTSVKRRVNEKPGCDFPLAMVNRLKGRIENVPKSGLLPDDPKIIERIVAVGK